MAPSAKVKASVACAVCGTRIDIDAWFLIGVEERWDLVEELGRGTLNAFPCHNCGTVTAPELPVLLFFAGAHTPFFCSPTAFASPEAGRGEAAAVERFARDFLRNQWQETWLVDGLLVMPREHLLLQIQDGSATQLRDWVVRVATEVWLRRLLDADQSDERAVVEAHGELLEPLASQVLKEWAEAESARGNTKTANTLTWYRTLLAQCRCAGIPEAFRQWNQPATEPIDEELNRLRLNLGELVARPNLNPTEVEEAISTCRAIVGIAKDTNPLVFAVAHGYLGIFLGLNTYEAVGHLEIAVGSAEVQATGPTVFRNFLSDYGQAVTLQRRPERFERAIVILESALVRALASNDSETAALIELELVKAYTNRTQGNPMEDLERAIEYGKRARDYFTLERSRPQWAIARLYLSNAYFRRVKDEKSLNLHTSIRLAEAVLEELKPGEMPELQATLHNNLGNHFATLAAGASRALEHCHRALEYYSRDRFPDDWAQLQLNFGYLFLKLPNGHSFESDDIETAIGYFERAIEVRTQARSPEAWATTQINLAIAYARRVKGDPESNAAEAIRCAQLSLEVFTPERYPLLWSQAQRSMASASLSRRQRYGPGTWKIPFEKLPERNVEQGLGYLRPVLVVLTPDRYPMEYAQIQLEIGHICFMRGRWKEAHTAYAEALAVGQSEFDEAYTEEGRQQAVEWQALAHSRDAWCLYRLGDVSAAFEQMEHGKVRRLDDWLALSETIANGADTDVSVDIKALRAEMWSLSAAMKSASANGDDEAWLRAGEAMRGARLRWRALVSQPPPVTRADCDPATLAVVAPLITHAGGLVFVLRGELRPLAAGDAIELPEFNSRAVSALLQGAPHGFMIRPQGEEPSYGWWLLESEQEKWPERIRMAAETLGDVLMGRVAERLAHIGVLRGDAVTILPQGRLGLLPLHAAPTGEGSRVFLDDYIVSFVPSRRVSSAIRRKSTPNPASSLLAVINPTRDLPFSELEGALIKARFGPAQSTTLQGTEATVESVMAQAPGRRYLHFACHGYFRWSDPSQSGLTMAAAETLNLAQVVRQLDLGGAHLVTLSACSTAQTESVESPEEFLGLQTAFLEAGAAAVICSLWPVNDISTALLMDRFYEGHLGGLPAAAALRDAQLWLRSVTAGELANSFGLRRAEAVGTNTAVSAGWRRFVSRPVGERPFAEPFFWAAFTFYGE